MQHFLTPVFRTDADFPQTRPGKGDAANQGGGATVATAATWSRCARVLLVLGVLSALVGSRVQGATVTIVHQFAPLITASQTPGSVIQGVDGNFYGLSSAGGTNGTGTVFTLSPTGVLTTLYSFSATNNLGDNVDGTGASAKLVQGVDGNFYGTALQGGANNTGTIFKVTPTGSFTTLVSFANVNPSNVNVGGAYPRSGLIQGVDGNFYGTASSGGANGKGIVFVMTPGGTLTTLYSFTAPNGASKNADGASPYAALVQGTDGTFYGLTSAGGANAQGTAFNITAAGTFTSLHSFSAVTNTSSGSTNVEGAKPTAALIQGTDGNFYGLAGSGGANADGAFFQLTPGGTVTALHSFVGGEGSGFGAALLQGSDGNFYGVAKTAGGNGVGGCFRLTAGGALTVLYSFDNLDGQGPVGALVQDASGRFYGVTGAGGVHSGGTFFTVTSDGTFNSLTSFGLISNADGSHSDAPLILAGDGNFYGTTNAGGAYGNGTVFKMTAAGAVTVLHTFSAEDETFTNADGSFPNGGLVQAGDGSFYGLTSGGGTGGAGTFFKITTAGVLTTLASFEPLDGASDNETGAYPYAAPVQGHDGSFYGTTTAGGANGNGTVFNVTPTGALTVLYTFSAANNGVNGDGSYPSGGLVQGADGNFYGTARYGGLNDTGTIFKVTPMGGFTTLSSFAALDDGNYNQGGAFPTKGLIQGQDGNFYGTAGYGGTLGAGTIFEVSPTGTLTTLYNFGHLNSNNQNPDGVEPEASLLQASNGNFYGTTYRGTTNANGIIFSLTPAGVFTTLYTFGATGSGGGARPNAGLVQGKAAGLLFGTTLNGGTGAGTVFRVNLTPNITGIGGTQFQP